MLHKAKAVSKELISEAQEKIEQFQDLKSEIDNDLIEVLEKL